MDKEKNKESNIEKFKKTMDMVELRWMYVVLILLLTVGTSMDFLLGVVVGSPMLYIIKSRRTLRDIL